MAVVGRAIVPDKPFEVINVAPGVHVRRLYPGGMAGPNGETGNDFPGGQTWSEFVLLGSEADDFIFAIPDVRLPANQYWPLHWHDCWTVVLIVEGSCILGDFHMTTDDVFVAAPSIEYGPLISGPKGCRLLEIFADLALSPGGYAPEYRDHPTLADGGFAFKPRSEVNRRNEGNSMLPLEGVPDIWTARFEDGWSWDLGDKGDPDRGVVKASVLQPGEKIAACKREDWYCALVLEGSVEFAGRTWQRDDAIVAERGAQVPDIVAGADGARVLESFRTARGMSS